MPAGEVVVTSVVALSLERAFRAFTDEIDRWWRRPPTHESDAIVRFDGDQLVAVSSSGSEVLATVAGWSPPDRLDLHWQGPHAARRDIVVIEFEPHDDGTRVTIRHQRAGLAPEAVDAAIVGLWWGDLLSRLVGAHRPAREHPR